MACQIVQPNCTQNIRTVQIDSFGKADQYVSNIFVVCQITQPNCTQDGKGTLNMVSQIMQPECTQK